MAGHTRAGLAGKNLGDIFSYPLSGVMVLRMRMVIVMVMGDDDGNGER